MRLPESNDDKENLPSVWEDAAMILATYSVVLIMIVLVGFALQTVANLVVWLIGV